MVNFAENKSRMKRVFRFLFSGLLVAMFCLGSVEAMAQDRTITRQSTPQPVRPTKEQQYQKDLTGKNLLHISHLYLH